MTKSDDWIRKNTPHPYPDSPDNKKYDSSVSPEYIDPSDRKYTDPGSYVWEMSRERDWWELTFETGIDGEIYHGQRNPPQFRSEWEDRNSQRI